ncbi:AraC family transcriptional regulator [Reinekea marinisedimentorum]|uniref:AraC family transcriptional regulator n=1 Tax=Reinekea marinisedimentorum TaxID=230495 RepID=A0A4V2UKC3_9GAMM|nr:AraC family transcriptional regulator [Reinekea marinisedimentorum]TCS43803.1 AraC family transcriptional regulator [Reinekea marinisedimentorum]
MLKTQQRRINDVLYRIHRDIDQPLNATALAQTANWSSFHFHRCFKAVTGENVNDYIRRVRLEMAANQLMFFPQQSIGQTLQQCGFVSQASFSHAFKKHFGCTPGQWRSNGYQALAQQNQQQWHDDLKDRASRAEHYPMPSVQVKTLPARKAAYVRHAGYGRDIRRAWEKLEVWARQQSLNWEALPKFGLHHSNADIIPLSQCHYVACIELDTSPQQLLPLNQLTIPGGSYACFDLQGVYGDLLPVLHKFYHDWLPNSGYSLAPTPGYAHYRRCHFMDAEERFDLTFCVPLWL